MWLHSVLKTRKTGKACENVMRKLCRERVGRASGIERAKERERGRESEDEVPFKQTNFRLLKKERLLDLSQIAVRKRYILTLTKQCELKFCMDK